MSVHAVAQSLLPTQGQIVAECSDAPLGLAAGETLGTATPVETACMNSHGKVLFRGRRPADGCH